MARASENELRTGSEPRGKFFDRLARHDLVVACGEHQHRHADAGRKPIVSEERDSIERGLQPADGRRPDGKLRGRLQHRQIAQETLAVRGDRVPLELLLTCPVFLLVARHRPLAEAEQGEPVGNLFADPLRHGQAQDLDHGRGHDHAVEPAAALGRRLEQHHRRHGVAERIIGRGTIRKHHRLHEVGQVFLILGEVVDMSLEGIARQPARSPLPAPVEHGHGKTAAAKLANHLEIFLDELGAPGEDADRAAALAQHRLPAREAQADPFAHLDIAGRRSERDRVLGCGDEIHRS